VEAPERIEPDTGRAEAEAAQAGAQLNEAVAGARAALAEFESPELPDTGSPGARIVIDAITTASEAGRQLLVGAAGGSIDAVESTVQDQHRALDQSQQQEQAKVGGAAEAGRAGVRAAVTGQNRSIRESSAAQGADLNAWRAEAAARSGQDIGQRASQVREFGTQQQELARTAGQDAAGEARGSFQAASGQARSGGGGGGSDPGGEPRAEVSERVGVDAAEQLDSAAAEADERFAAPAAEAGAEIRSGADQVGATIAAEADVLNGRLGEVATSANAQIGQAATVISGGLRTQGGAAADQMTAAEQGATAALRGHADRERGQIASAGAGLIEGLQQQARRALRASVQTQEAAAHQIAQAELDEETAATVASEAGAELASSHEQAAAEVGAAADVPDQELVRAASNATVNLGEAAEQAADGFVQTDQQFGQEAARVGGQAAAAMSAAGAAATTAGESTIAETGQRLGGAVTTAGSELTGATGEVRDSLGTQVAATEQNAGGAVSDTRSRIDQGHQRVNSEIEPAPAQRASVQRLVVQRGFWASVGDWFASQLDDLLNMLMSPSFWVGLIVTLVLFPFIGPAAIAVGGLVGGAVSGIEENVRDGRPWYDYRAIVRNAAIGLVAGAAVALGIGVLVLAGAEGAALTLGFMGVSALVGVGVNVATGQAPDRGLLANLFLAWLFQRYGNRLPGGRGRGAEPVPEEPVAPGGRSTVQRPGLYEGIDPATPPEGGWVFNDTVTQSGGRVTVETNVTAPDGSTGSMGRSYRASDGRFSMDYAFLDQIPLAMRMVRTQPEMLPGRGTPLEAYMTMRQMRIIESRTGATFSGPRTVHMSTIINARTIAELALAEAAGTPANRAILNTHSVQYARNSITQSGGRIQSARVSGGQTVRAGDVMTASELAQHNLRADQSVRYGFDIDLLVVPAEPATGGGQGGITRVPAPLPSGEEE
jgi:hypothetical protein